jgi:hypothetical protein
VANTGTDTAVVSASRSPNEDSADASPAENVLEELAELDAQRAKLALEQGQHMLEKARERTVSSGAVAPDVKQRHGDLVQTQSDLKDDIRLLVIGKAGEKSMRDPHTPGGQVESVIRAFHQPILIANGNFKKPEKAMVAFDGSATSQKTIDVLISSPFCTGLQLHLVTAGKNSADNQARLDKARSTLATSGLLVKMPSYAKSTSRPFYRRMRPSMPSTSS